MQLKKVLTLHISTYISNSATRRPKGNVSHALIVKSRLTAWAKATQSSKQQQQQHNHTVTWRA